MTSTPTRTGPTAGEPDLSELIAGAVRAVPGVAGLHGGAFGEVATYLPGSQIAGVRMNDGRIAVHFTAVAGYPIHSIADAVRTAIRELSNHPVDVTVEDIAVPTIT